MGSMAEMDGRENARSSTLMNTIVKAKKNELLHGLDTCMDAYTVAALTQQDGQVLFNTISSSKEVMLDYQPTVLPPKKFFFPQQEDIVEYTDNGEITALVDTTSLVIFGVRPCDLNGIRILTEAFSDKNGDPNYMTRRENIIVIGIECHEICDDDAFCYKVKGNVVSEGYDILLADVDDDYLMTFGTDKGKAFADKYFSHVPAEQKEWNEYYKKKGAALSEKGKVPYEKLETLPEIFHDNKHHDIWKEEGSRCLSCGSCVMVCPTCYCFDIVDEYALNLKKGTRTRKWDGCMLHDFAVISSGENFREKKEDRLRHRMNRKFNYLMKKHGQSVCVGCGRCVRACLADISPKTIVNRLTGEENKEEKGR